MMGSEMTEATLKDWLVAELSARLSLPADEIDPDESLEFYGLDSAEAVTLSGDLESLTGRSLPATFVWEHPSITAIARFLCQDEYWANVESQRPIRVSDPADDIAIIGFSCRFPGARNADEFWDLLYRGIDAITDPPADRIAPDSSGGYLSGIDEFDAAFFRMTPKEAQSMDPQHRLLLETTWEALEHSGQSPLALGGTQTGTFVGISTNDYLLLQSDGAREWDAYLPTGNARNMAANRISYLLDIKGPSLAVDTACSSSLVAIHLACQSLRQSECQMAIAGGVNLLFADEVSRALASAGMLSPSGRCRTFSANADGYVRGEGVGVLILKRLEDARKDRDRVHAIIRGSAVNQDGQSNGITAPSVSSQVAVLRKALQCARVEARDISYIETHGTGTPLGDPIEVSAILSVMGTRPTQPPCVIGSVKTNIGHLEAAAGIAGVIKVILCFAHDEIPRHLHLDEQNPHVDLTDTALVIAKENTRWPREALARRAGVSSFGFGGTNVHLILEEGSAETPSHPAVSKGRWHLLKLSAKSRPALLRMVERYSAFLKQADPGILAGFCATASAGRADFEHRICIRGESISTLQQDLDTFLQHSASRHVHIGHVRNKKSPRIAFLCTGQGSQYAGMGRELYEQFSPFRAAIDQCDDISRRVFDVSLKTILFDSDDSVMRETVNSQPSLFALGYALAQMWQEWGVRPCAVMGHSLGEYVAACVAGVMDLETALSLVMKRARLMQELKSPGKMISVQVDLERLREIIRSYNGKVSVAAINGLHQVVLSGEALAIDAVCHELSNQRLAYVALHVSHAFHSPIMEPITAEFEQYAKRYVYRAPGIPIVANLSGRFLRANELMDGAYWTRHIESPVQFAEGAHALFDSGIDALVELGPSPVLIDLSKRLRRDEEVLRLPSLVKGSSACECVLDTLGSLYAVGATLNWSSISERPLHLPIELPTYPFERVRYWISEAASYRPEIRSLSDRTIQVSQGDDPLSTTAPHRFLEDLLLIAKNQSQVLVAQTQLFVGASALQQTERTNLVPDKEDSRCAWEITPSPDSQSTILRAIAGISGYIVADLNLEFTIVGDLGFDSIMITQLHGALSKAFPDHRVAMEQLLQDLTIRQLIQLVSGARAASLLESQSDCTSTAPIPEEFYKIDLFPECVSFQKRLSDSRIANPYFRERDGSNENVIRVDDRELLNFSSYNYLSLAGHPLVIASAQSALHRFGTSVSASRLLSGEIPLHRQLEEAIARFLGVEAAMTFSAGHATNVTTISHLVDEQDLIVHDELCHNSIIQGCLMSGATRRPFRHNDWRNADDVLTRLRSSYRRALIIIEGVYSMDGDTPDLSAFVHLKQRHHALLFVDEAHSVGVMGEFGRGICEHCHVSPGEVDILMGTLSKSLASCGGYIAGGRSLIEYLKYTAPGFIFSAGISPANTAAALAAVEVLEAEPQRVARLHEVAHLFATEARARGLAIGLQKQTPIIPVILGDSQLCMEMTQRLLRRGISVHPIVYPAVPEESARLRFFVTAAHSDEQVRLAVEATAEELDILRNPVA